MDDRTTNKPAKKISKSKEELQREIDTLKAEINSVEADAAILLKENMTLLELCEKHVPNFDASTLLTSEWREQYDAENH